MYFYNLAYILSEKGDKKLHCNNCGEKISGNKAFCTKCGTTIENQNPITETRTKSPGSGSFFKSKSSKVLSISVILLLMVGFAGYITVQSMYKPAKVVKEFEEAIESSNSKDVANILNGGQDVMKVEEADAKMLIKYFDENPDLLAETKSNLKKKAQYLERAGDTGFKDEGFLTLQEVKKKWGIITQYGVSFQPVYVKVSTNQPNASISINDKNVGELKEEEERTFGPFLPVMHEVKGAYKGEYTTVTDEVKIDSLEEDDHKIPVELDLTGDEVYLTSNYDEATVFVNGKSTGKTVEELESFGPVSLDGKLKIHAEMKIQDKTLKSKKVSVENNSIELWVDDTEIEEAEERAYEAAAIKEMEEEEVIAIINEHYEEITNGNYESAYELFSTGRKGKNKFSSWEKGLKDNMSDEVSYAEVESMTDSKATVSFEMVSEDWKDGETLVQTWRGKWHLVKESSGWKLSDPEIKLVDTDVQ